MLPSQHDNQVVFTQRAQCRDCYRCIRVCPVHAIGMREGQAFVDPELCIACGTCIRECPQQAKQYRRDLELVRTWLQNGVKIAISLAPSFAALYPDWQIQRLPSALRRLGFNYIAETAVCATTVAEATVEHRQEQNLPCIASSCPAVVGYICHHAPEQAPYLAPVPSPMLAHARHLKTKHGTETKVVFVGPCVAKKREADAHPEVDAVLTFSELTEWFTEEGIDLAQLEESDFDEQAQESARVFALPAGSFHTAKQTTDMLAPDHLAVSGLEALEDLLQTLRESDDPILAEPLFCVQGCVNGPALETEASLFQRRAALLHYQQERPPQATQPDPVTYDSDLVTPGTHPPPHDEQKIRDILRQTGKETPEDQLNCGACGYASCREQAWAVARGMAETEMCVPLMRRLAEQRTDRIVETSPNGIVVLDRHLKILHMNASFRKLFMATPALIGRNISVLMDPQPLEDVATGDCPLKEVTVRHKRYGLVCHQIIYHLPEEDQVVGVFVNMTGALASKKQLESLRVHTLKQARNLLDHQVHMAGKIADYLGQSTAESEQLLGNLMRLAGDDPDAVPLDPNLWNPDTTTLM